MSRVLSPSTQDAVTKSCMCQVKTRGGITCQVLFFLPGMARFPRPRTHMIWMVDFWYFFCIISQKGIIIGGNSWNKNYKEKTFPGIRFFSELFLLMRFSSWKHSKKPGQIWLGPWKIGLIDTDLIIWALMWAAYIFGACRRVPVFYHTMNLCVHYEQIRKRYFLSLKWLWTSQDVASFSSLTSNPTVKIGEVSGWLLWSLATYKRSESPWQGC